MIDERRRVDVVHDEVEPAVVVEIGVRGAVREARLIHPPLRALVGKGEVAVVAEEVVGRVVRGEILAAVERPRGCIASPACCDRHGGHVVEIVHGLRIAVADEDVLVAVVVEVGEQRAPAPVRRRHAGEARDLAEHDIASA